MKKFEITLTDNEAKMLSELIAHANEKTCDYYGSHGLDCTNTNINEFIGNWISKKHNEVFKK